MNLIVRLAARNTLRRRNRTLLTSGMVVFSVALLVLALSWIKGVFGGMLAQASDLAGHVRIVDREFLAREELMPLDEHLADAPKWIELLSKQPGVLSVEPRITTGVTVSAGEEIGEVFALAVGANERYFRDRLHAKEKIVEGGWFTGAPDEVIVGAKVFAEAKAKVGEELVMLGQTQDGSLSPIKAKIVGVTHAGGFLDQQVFLPLAKLQYLADIDAGATELLVYGVSYEDALRLSTSLAALPELKDVAVQSLGEREPYKSMGDAARGVRAVFILVVVLLTALGIWNTMMMSVLERTHEIGVLRAMGLSRLGTLTLFVGEAVTIAVLGGFAGVALGAYPAWLLETKGVHLGEQTVSSVTAMISETIHADLSFGTVTTAFLLGVGTAVIGSFVPALRAASIQPVTAMRSGR